MSHLVVLCSERVLLDNFRMLLTVRKLAFTHLSICREPINSCHLQGRKELIQSEHRGRPLSLLLVVFLIDRKHHASLIGLLILYMLTSIVFSLSRCHNGSNQRHKGAFAFVSMVLKRLALH